MKVLIRTDIRKKKVLLYKILLYFFFSFMKEIVKLKVIAKFTLKTVNDSGGSPNLGK